MGNPRKPAALRLLEGNRGKRPIPVEPEPAGDVAKPRGLRGRASAIWDELVPVLVDMGTLKSPDAHQFAVWCKLAAKSETQFNKMTVGELTALRLIGDGLGMSAVGRAKLGTVEKRKPDNPFSKIA